MRMRTYIAGLFGLITVAVAGLSALLPAAAAEAAPMPQTEGPALVAEVIDAETLRLADGQVLRLAGIMVPNRPTGPDARYARAARQAVALLVQDRPVVFAVGARRMDRHGRFLAQVWQAGDDGAVGGWVQGALLADGLARVATTPDNLLLVPDMLRIEDDARQARRGLWDDAVYRVRTPEDAGDAVDSFQIVEGRVLAVAIRRRAGYLNFGADYRTDFTLSLSREALRLMRQANVDPMALQGIRVRARGWLRLFNGPLIEITHPEQIEVLQ
jgi:endonuclease YncB( thermonuclease family)